MASYQTIFDLVSSLHGDYGMKFCLILTSIMLLSTTSSQGLTVKWPESKGSRHKDGHITDHIKPRKSKSIFDIFSSTPTTDETSKDTAISGDSAFEAFFGKGLFPSSLSQ
ncbi:hypothetical protein, partial [Escherichia coli]|uniref:hypothetical protein n=1 Tax=Escherichia coli TaxID=562 RepID=UPI00307A826E